MSVSKRSPSPLQHRSIMADVRTTSPACAGPSNRDREGPHGLPPPTPPDIRVTYPAVRQIKSGSYMHPNRSVISRHASRAFIPEAEHRSPPRRMASRRSIPGHYSLPPFRPSARSCVPTKPSADVCRAVRKDYSPLSPMWGHPADLARSAVIPSVHRRLIDKAQSIVDGGRCCRVPARPDYTTPPIRFVSLAPHMRSTLPSDPTSR